MLLRVHSAIIKCITSRCVYAALVNKPTKPFGTWIVSAMRLRACVRVCCVCVACVRACVSSTLLSKKVAPIRLV